MTAIKCMEYPCKNKGVYTVLRKTIVLKDGKEMFGTGTKSLLCPAHTKSLEETQEYFRAVEMSIAYKRGEIKLPVL